MKSSINFGAVIFHFLVRNSAAWAQPLVNFQIHFLSRNLKKFESHEKNRPKCKNTSSN